MEEVNSKLSGKELVTRGNALIKARYNLDVLEQKLVWMLCSKIQPDDEEFYTYRFAVRDVARHCGGELNIERNLQRAVMSIASKPVKIETEDGWLITNWMSTEYFRGKGIIELTFNNKLRPYLLGLKSLFTSIPMSRLMCFTSKYSGRVYELVKSLQGQGVNKLAHPIAIEELKLMLGIEKERAYRLFSNVKLKVLDVSVAEIREKTPDLIAYEVIKTGRRITHIRFSISLKPEPEELDTEPHKDALGNEVAGFAQIRLPFTETVDTLQVSCEGIGISKASYSRLVAKYGQKAVEHGYQELQKMQRLARTEITNPPGLLTKLAQGYEEYAAMQKKQEAEREQARAAAAESVRQLEERIAADADASGEPLDPKIAAMKKRMLKDS